LEKVCLIIWQLAAAEFQPQFFCNLHPARDVLLLLRVFADGHQRADFLKEFVSR
jgi:hypothetical protein